MADGTYSLDDGSGVDLRFKIVAGLFAVDPTKTYIVTGPMSLHKDASSGKVVNVILVKNAAYRSCIRISGDGSTWQMGEPMVSYWAGPGAGGVATDFNVAQLASGGWNTGWDVGWSRTREPKHLLKYSNNGMRVILHLGGFVNLWEPLGDGFNWDDPAQTAELDNLINKHRNDPALYAYFLQDEPGAERFPFFGKFVEHLRKIDPTRPTIVNLLPSYAWYSDPSVFDSYLTQYMEIVRPDLVTYDNYPFTGVGGYEWWRFYFRDMEQVRRVTQEAGIPFMNFPQVSPFYAFPHTVTEGEVRWQYYASLAYGVQGILDFVYNEESTGSGLFQSSASYAPYNDYTTPLPIWYAVSGMNREFVAIGKEIQPLKCLAAYHTTNTPSGAKSLPNDSPFTVAPAGANEGFVLGCFTKSGAVTHVLVANKSFTSPVSATLDGPGPMDVFDTSTRTWAEKTDSVSLDLPPGGGALLRLR